MAEDKTFEAAIAAAGEAAARGGAGHPNAEKPMPSFLQKSRPQGPPPPPQTRELDKPPQAQPRDTRDIRELAQQIDVLMFEIIDRLKNLNEWLGQLPRIK